MATDRFQSASHPFFAAQFTLCSSGYAERKLFASSKLADDTYLLKF